MSVLDFSLEMILLLSASGFILGLRFLGSPKHARLGNGLGSLAMLLAVVVATLQVPSADYTGIFAAILLGSIVGVFVAKKVEMTSMPQLVALFNGFGGLASVLVATAEILRFWAAPSQTMPTHILLVTWFSVVIGALTLTGSLVAFGKLQGLLKSAPFMFVGQKFLTLILLIAVLSSAYYLYADPGNVIAFWGALVGAAILGLMLVMPIGGADMPVVIALLNSYSGVAALSAGFVVESRLLIIAGALVGASGLILTRLMCTAMNRSLANVMFGGMGAESGNASGGEVKPMREYLPADAATLLNQARQVIVVPGYGLAVSQAQHAIRELADELKARGVTVLFGIHPVAGRMPGHMNVLLAEANIPYEDLKDLEEVNGEFENTDVTLVIGANDVVNPDAKTEKSSPLYGMPILDAHKSQNVVVFKRGYGKGFSGVENPLFTLDKSGVVFGDAKGSLVKVLSELKNL